jgi:hypothetical protein
MMASATAAPATRIGIMISSRSIAAHSTLSISSDKIRGEYGIGEKAVASAVMSDAAQSERMNSLH